MIRPRYFPIFLIVLCIMASMYAEVHAGPLSLSFARSFRSGREIRTPFKGSGIMVARGFGKRNVFSSSTLDDANIPSEKTLSSAGTTTTTTIDKFKPLSFQKGNNGGGAANIYGDGFNNERIALDCMLSDMAANPNLVRILLHRLMDYNADNAGKLSQRADLAGAPLESIEYF